MIPEPRLDPDDDDDRTEEERLADEEALADKLISDYEDRLLDDTPPNNWP